MDFWQRARSFAEDAAKRSQDFTKEAAKRSQEFTKEAAKRSQELTISSSKLFDVVSEASKEIAVEASKRSRELATEASKRADLIKNEALKRADQIKSQIPLSQLVDSPSSSSSFVPVASTPSPNDLEEFGVTEELREFVQGITINTFEDFPFPDDSNMSNVPAVSNVRQDLTEWQEKHAKLVLSSVPEISRLRYQLCPRTMKERKFWRIYFILVNSHVAPYEKRYMECIKLKSPEKVKDEVAKEVLVKDEVAKDVSTEGTTSKTGVEEMSKKKKTSSTTAMEDLDVFLLGDNGDSDERTDDGDEGFDDDFDKL